MNRSSSFLFGISVSALAFVLSAVACADLKTGTTDGSDAGASSSSGSSNGGTSSGTSGTGTSSSSSGSSSGKDASSSGTTSSGGAGFGPGPHGSLPSGYCCDADEQCRQRHCEDVNGSGKMCLDACRSNSSCVRPPDFNFTCDNGGTPGNDGFCKPTAAFKCIAAGEFERGTKVPGNCCTATGDGIAGLECEGSMCIAIGDGPFVCTHVCAQPKDCPSGFVCQQITDTRKECIPANTPYTCN